MLLNKTWISSRLAKTLVIITVAVLVILLNPKNLFSPIRYVTFFVFSPFQKIFYQTGLWLSDTKNFLSSIGDLKNENERLIEENHRLKVKNVQLLDMEKENDFLRKQVDLLPREKFELEAAYVISRDPYMTGNWIEISKGTNSGIKTGMLAIVSSGILIGKINEVYPDSSRIILLSSPESLIGSVDIATEARGIVRGEFGLGMLMDMVQQSDSINKGDEIITSGGGGIPRGLLIGELDEVKLSRDGLFQQATVVSPIKVSELKAVFIIKEDNNDNR